MEKISGQYRGVVIDNEAGLEHLSRRTSGEVEIMLVVCHATAVGARTAARIVEMRDHLQLQVGQTFLVLNQFDGNLGPELADAFARTGLETLGVVPADPLVASFDVEGRSLLQLPADSTAVRAVHDMLKMLNERRLI